MKDDAAARALAFVAGHHVMTLATYGPLGLWAAAVFYAHDGFRLVFLSAEHTRHAQNMAASPHVAATIQDDYDEWQTIQGIQLEGVVRLLSGTERSAALALFAGRFRFLSSPTAAIEAALRRISWYSLEPERLYFVDNTQGFGHRDEIAL
jgi:uncharacterized protein YhbP (UPF0306 family)